MTFRVEHDSLSEVQVPADRLRGAQTERSLADVQSPIPAVGTCLNAPAGFSDLAARGINEPGPSIVSGVSFTRRCAAGIEPNRKRIPEHLQGALMWVTGLNPHIGYQSSTVWGQSK